MNASTNPEMLHRDPDEEIEAPEAVTPAEAGAQVEPPVPTTDAFSVDMVKRVLEAALLSTAEPLTVPQLKRLFSGQVDADTLRKLLEELRGEWEGRSIELTAVASGWRARVKPEYQSYLDRIATEKSPRYSRAVLETLAIVAYRQPVTRGDIEEVRGVAVSPPTLKALEERGWIEVVGHRETPGRPALFATTRKFLDDLNLRSLEELPALEELQSALEPLPTLAGLEVASLQDEAQQDLIADETPTPEAQDDAAPDPDGTVQDATDQEEPGTHAR